MIGWVAIYSVCSALIQLELPRIWTVASLTPLATGLHRPWLSGLASLLMMGTPHVIGVMFGHYSDARFRDSTKDLMVQ